jgi:hypothetical protein
MGFDWGLFTSVFFLIAVTELPDKTIFATLVLASQGSPLPTFLGVAMAFVVQSVVAILFGQVLGLLPPQVIQGVAAFLFFVFSYSMWTKKPESPNAGSPERSKRFFQAALNSFMVIFIAEWGDLTQLATAALEAKYHQGLTIFLAATSALWVVTALAVVLGSQLGKWIDPALFQKIAAFSFACVGFVFLVKIF